MNKQYQLLILFSLLLMSAIMGAQTLTYTLEWNDSESHYEVWATPDFTIDEIYQTSSKVSIVLDALSAPRTFTHINSTYLNYSPMSSRLFKPKVAPTKEFFSWYSECSQIEEGSFISNGVSVLLFTFTMSDGQDDSIRLWDNTTDPEPYDTDMLGFELDNSFATMTVPTFVGVDHYIGNTISSRSAIHSYPTPLSVDIDDELKSIQLYPNPSNDIVNISGDIDCLKSIELFTVTGQFLKQKETDLSSMDISDLKSGVYFVILYSDTGKRSIRLLKE